MRRHSGPHVDWREQRDFRQDFIAILQAVPPGNPVLLLVDDDIVFRQFDDATVFDRFTVRHLFIDLYFYIEDGRNARLPFVRRQPYYEWKWAYYIKWRRPRIYPFSLDGHIYERDILLRLARQTLYKAPNSLESALHAEKRRWFVWRRSLALAACDPVIFNNPINSVQTEGETEHLDFPSEELNRRFCEGYEIDNKALYRVSPHALHFPVPILMVSSSSR